jgi:hypothetical protein
LAQPNASQFVLNNPAVMLYAGLGPEIYLRLDGRVFIREDWIDEDAGIQETTDLHEAAAGLVIAARHYALPELLTLLPSRPHDANDCQDVPANALAIDPRTHS